MSALPKNSRAAGRAALLVLLTSSYAFRLPALLNARSTNSDAAVVGLQAMHLLRGELSAFLWGSGYQTAVDSFVAAAFFAVLGPSPLVLMLSALTLHVVATVLVFVTLRRRFAPLLALIVALPLVVSPSSVQSYALYPPRQASLTLALAAFWAVDGARRRGPRSGGGSPAARTPASTMRWMAAGGALATLAVSADPYPMLLLPLVTLYAVLVAWPLATGSERGRALVAFAAGSAAGLVPFVVLHRLAGARSGPMGLTTSMLAHHWRLLVDECLPWALSYKVYFARNVMDYQPWDAPAWFRALGVLGALLLLAMVLYGLVSPLRRALPPPVRRLGFVGALAFPLATGAFLVSVMVMDHFSMRYLAVLTLMTPFAMTPAASALGLRRFAPAIAPHLLASAIAGWVGYGPFVHGIVPVRETPELRDDYTLFAMLRESGVRYAVADYWASYRLTYLFREELIVVPSNPGEDRHAPYRQAWQSEPRFAYIYDPGRSREDLGAVERELTAANARVETRSAGRLKVFLVTR